MTPERIGAGLGWILNHAIAFAVLGAVYLIFEWWRATGRLARGE